MLGIMSEADIVANERGPVAKRGRLAEWFARRPRRADQERLTARTAGEAMTSPAITIDSWQSAVSAAAVMLDRRVDRLPVLEEGKLVGIVTRADLMRAFSRSDGEIERDIREDVMLRSFCIPEGKTQVAVRDGEVTLTGTIESDLMTELLPEAIPARARRSRRPVAASGSTGGSAQSALRAALRPALRRTFAERPPPPGGEAARGTPFDRVKASKHYVRLSLDLGDLAVPPEHPPRHRASDTATRWR